MNDQQIAAYKELAAQVMKTAVQDVRRKKCRLAMPFLTAPEYLPIRAVWLTWLGFDEDGFQALLRRELFQGHKNRMTK